MSSIINKNAKEQTVNTKNTIFIIVGLYDFRLHLNLQKVTSNSRNPRVNLQAEIPRLSAAAIK